MRAVSKPFFASAPSVSLMAGLAWLAAIRQDAPDKTIAIKESFPFMAKFTSLYKSR